MAEHTSGRPHAEELVEEGILAMISTNRSMVKNSPKLSELFSFRQSLPPLPVCQSQTEV